MMILRCVVKVQRLYEGVWLKPHAYGRKPAGRVRIIRPCLKVRLEAELELKKERKY